MKFLLASTALMLSALPTLAAAQVPIAATQTISGTRLDLSVRGESRAVPDIALINAGVTTQAVDAATAMRDNAARMSRVVAALKAAGIADRDIQTQSVSLSPQYRYANNEAPVITGYQANNTVNVRFRDIAKAGAVLDVLVKEGANQINGPTLTLDKPQAAQDAARLDAMKQLRARAALYAQTLGMRVKRIVALSESADYSAPPMPYMSMRAEAADAKTSIAPGEQSVGVTISATFELE